MGWTISLLYWDQVDGIEMPANGSVYIGDRRGTVQTGDSMWDR